KKPGDSPPSSLIRSWLAIALVLGLLLFTVFSFHLSDTSLSNTLVGATAASAGSVVAFYFASKASDQARQDILGAISPTVSVPDVTGQSKATATSNLQHARLGLSEASGSATGDDARVQSQKPLPNTRVQPGTTVEVTLA
ncbi:MAG: hypothetical protein QOD07_1482, partial [Frankiaceae bacterium]|nr:hypothetical protein [Frankiaceae bacterium]